MVWIFFLICFRQPKDLYILWYVLDQQKNLHFVWYILDHQKYVFCLVYFRPPKDLYYDGDKEVKDSEKEDEKKKIQARQSKIILCCKRFGSLITDTTFMGWNIKFVLLTNVSEQKLVNISEIFIP